ncbi:MAG TPA: hypothetical protein VM694_04285 [Polyangium sp.]|nr:hypothetical protein [Polyangium sp.]
MGEDRFVVASGIGKDIREDGELIECVFIVDRASQGHRRRRAPGGITGNRTEGVSEASGSGKR